MDRTAVVAWQARWRAVEARIDEEARRMTSIERLTILARLWAFGRLTGAVSADDSQVWERFERLRALHRGRLAAR
jgi:hypothetical protein